MDDEALSRTHEARPLQVYLDSSDYSVLADKQIEYADVSKELERLKLNGRVQFRLSFALIAEAAPTELKFLPIATARLNAIRKWCWPHALVSHSDVFEHEARNLRDRCVHRLNPFREDGDWSPAGVGALALPSHEKLVQNSIDMGKPSREVRRRLRRTYFNRSGKTNAAGVKLITESERELIQDLSLQFPLTDVSRDALSRYIRGQLSGHDALRVVLDSMRDPTVFATWLSASWSDASTIVTWLRGAGESHRRKIEAVSEVSRRLFATQLAGGRTQDEVIAMARYQFDAMANALVLKSAQISLEGDGVISVEGLTRSDLHNLAPGTTTASLLLFELAIQSCVVQESQRTPKVSDSGDLLHCAYLPYVDLLRADRHVAATIKSIVPQYADRIVPTLRDLPAALDRLLTGRQSPRCVAVNDSGC